MATELDLYGKFKTLCNDSSSINRFQELRGFAIGDFDRLVSNNLEQDPNSDYVYSQDWTDAGADAGHFIVSFPLCYLMPPTSQKATNIHTDYTVTFRVMDVWKHDGAGNDSNAYSLRSKEEIWKDANKLAEYLRDGVHSLPIFNVLNKQGIEITRFYDDENKRLAGVECRMDIRVLDDC